MEVSLILGLVMVGCFLSARLAIATTSIVVNTQ